MYFFAEHLCVEIGRRGSVYNPVKTAYPRIVHLADVYDALRRKRPYKSAFDHETACDIIINGDKKIRPAHFDPVLLEVFKKHAKEFKEIYSSGC